MQVTLDDNVGDDGAVEPFEALTLITGEIARLVFPTPGGECVPVHTLEARQVIDGVLLWEEKSRKDKTKYSVPATVFVGKRACPGEPDWMRDHGGIDVRKCPACQAAEEFKISELIPELRYALPVIRIATKSKGTTDVQDPPNAKIYVLSLTQRQYRELSINLKGIRELYDWPPEHEVRPRDADIILYCEDGDWKRYVWRAPMRPAWATDRNPALNAFIGALWRNPENRPSTAQLQLACARAADLRWLSVDVERVTDSYAEWRRVEKGGSAVSHGSAETAQTSAGPGDLGEGLDDLDALVAGDPGSAASQDELAGLGEFDAETSHGNGNGAKPAAPADSGPDLVTGEVGGGTDDLFGDTPAEPAAAEPAAEPAAAAPAPAGGDVKSFDDVLGDL